MSDLHIFGLCLALSLLFSTVLYIYLVRKTRIRKRFLATDNVAVALVTAVTVYLIFRAGFPGGVLFMMAATAVLVTLLAFLLTMARFWRTPVRKTATGEAFVVSPADGRVIYINRVEKGEIPVARKGSVSSPLGELAKTGLLDGAGWHIGINMTPFDVHKNCAPVSGRLVLNKHTDGKFLSLKDGQAITDNERNTYVIETGNGIFGVVQIASRLVRRIDSYVSEGTLVEKGQWIGMIRFGSQVDLILPRNHRILAAVGEQVYAATTVIAERNEDTD